MADTIAAGYEDHGGGRDIGDVTSIVKRPARDFGMLEAQVLRGGGQGIDTTLIEMLWRD